MSKYLYGASVQGIQEFIFATNKLKEIVGASELVKSVVFEFEKISAYKGGDEHILLNAAGNIKAIFDDKDLCEKVVLEFPKLIQKSAYGISISQAVLEIKDKHTQEDINQLEKKLKIQRNKPSIALDLSINIMKLNPSTAKPLISKDMDKATSQKLQAYESIKDKSNTDLHKLSNSKNKIAVVHIDGNGLGQLIPKLKIPLSEFSFKLDQATQEAFKLAKGEKALREIILGGDDVTVICNADDALDFTKEFLSNFETQTEKTLGNKLTACAGIAYTNEKYPFHYAVDLAETLCGVSKKHSKKINEDLAPSSLMFHNIQSSNFQSWDKFIEDERTIKNDKGIIRLDFGPYYLDEKNQVLIQDFQNSLEAYKCDGSPISRLRNWMGELYKNAKNADTLLERINTITDESGKWNSCIMDRNLKNINQELSSQELIIDKDGFSKTPIYDILQILSVTSIKGTK
ncbi:MAG: hypothetical protein Q9M43_06950 [Sulfurimonas sp.]|nr:hypothetical protein [Sulfurimonas sp.]